MGHRIGTFLLIGLLLLSSAPLHTAAAQDEVQKMTSDSLKTLKKTGIE